MSTKDELILQRDEQIRELKDKIVELEGIIYEYEENDYGFMLSDTEQIMLKIICREIERLNETNQHVSLDKDELKKFDTLVKDIVSIRGKLPTPKTEKDDIGEKSEAELIALVTNS